MGWPNDVTARLCLMTDLRVLIIQDEVASVYTVKPGNFIEDRLLSSEPYLGHADFAGYECANCGKSIGYDEEHWNEMRAHLGKRNPEIHPFGGNI